MSPTNPFGGRGSTGGRYSHLVSASQAGEENKCLKQESAASNLQLFQAKKLLVGTFYFKAQDL